MHKPRIYIDTTIPSAYFDERTASGMAARRETTRRWWASSADYEMLTSMAVREELAAGPPLRRRWWLLLINPVPLLVIDPEVVEVAAAYHHHKLMPPGDAIHLAVASFYRCEYLLTWNFKHLANPNKFRHIQSVNRGLRMHTPRIVTPLALLEDEDGQA